MGRNRVIIGCLFGEECGSYIGWLGRFLMIIMLCIEDSLDMFVLWVVSSVL